MTNKWKEFQRIISRFKGLTTISISTAISNGIGALFWLIMASVLGTDLYGQVSYLIAIAIIASRVSLVGATNTLMVYVPKGVKIQLPIFTNAIITSVITSIVVFFAFLNDIGVSLYILGFVVFTLITSDLLGSKAYKNYAKYLISQKVLLVVLSFSLFYVIGFDGVILGIALSFFPYIVSIVKKFQKEKIDWSVIKSKKRFIINSYILDLSEAFNGSLDKLIIAPLLGFALLGNYQLGVQFLALLTIVPGMIFQYILPHDASGNPNKTLKKFMIIISVILAITSIILAPIILPVLFPKFGEAIEVVQIISLTVIPVTIVTIYISKFLGMGESKIVLIGSGVYLGVQIPAIIILAGIFGVNGAAGAIVLGNSIQAIYFFFINYFYKIQEK